MIETLNATLNSSIPSRTPKEWRVSNRELILEWRENNKELILENAKIYYENNKEIINEKRKEKFNCECGGCFTKSSKSRHLKSQKHLKYLASAIV